MTCVLVHSNLGVQTVPTVPPLVCVACRTVQPAADLEVFPSPDGPRVRCADEDACRERFRPRRLAWSVRRAS